MRPYHKVHGLYKRYREGEKKGKFIIGEYSRSEFELLKDIKWVWTEKIDGTNIRVCWYRCPLVDKVEFKGKTDKAEVPKHLLERLKELFPPEKLRTLFPLSEEAPDVCLYGEGYGYKIQKGCKYFGGEKKVDFILFDIKIGNTWLKREDVEEITRQLGIDVVPIIGEGTIDQAVEIMTKQGFYSTFSDSFLAEGIVLRPKIELLDRRGHRIITKLKHKDWEGYK